MSPLEITEWSLIRLIADLEPDLSVLEETAGRIRVASGTRPDPELDAGSRALLALELHRYYTALETTLLRILRVVDREVPGGENWHRDLLRQAALPVPDLRPAILPPAVAGEASHLLSFRHFFRYAYAVELDWEELEAHRRRMARLHPDIISGLRAMVTHLRAALDSLTG